MPTRYARSPVSRRLPTAWSSSHRDPMNRREFLESLAIAAAAGLPIASRAALSGDASLYDIPRFGNVSLMHITDCHAQLLPTHFREPSVNLGVAGASGQPPHLVGEGFLKKYGIRPGTPEAHAF